MDDLRDLLLFLLVVAGLCWWLWPLTAILVFAPVAVALIVRRRRSTSNEPPYILASAAVVSGGVVGVQLVQHGQPVLWWLVTCLAGLLVLWIARRWANDPELLIVKVLASASSALWSAAGGIALVVGMQVVFAYRGDTDPEQVKRWIHALQVMQAGLEQVVVLGPLRLGALLVALVGVTAVLPSLRAVRNYRRIARAASLALVFVTAATSFTFFTAHSTRRWEVAWVAQRGSNLDGALAALDADRRDTVKLAALEDALRNLPEAAHVELSELAHQIDRYPEGEPASVRMARENQEFAQAVERRAATIERGNLARIERSRMEARGWHVLGGSPSDALDHDPRASFSRAPSHPVELVERGAMWERVTSELAQGLSPEPIADRARRAAAELEAIPETPAESARDQAIARLRDARLAPSTADAGLDDLEVLGVEQQRAHAARQEAYESAIQLVVSSIVPHSELAMAFLDGFLSRIKLTSELTRFVNRRRVSDALHAPQRYPPPVWQPELHQALRIPDGSLHSDPEHALAGVARRVTAAREEAARSRAESVERSAQDRVDERRREAEWRSKSPEQREAERMREFEGGRPREVRIK